ncbi:MAG: type II toxin-antitoxin system PemK/MazF family toxin [Pyrinomonadaceae bacterium]
MAMVKRFDIFLLNLDSEISDDAKNTRPCVVLSPDEMNRHISTAVVAPVSTTNQKYPTRIPFEFLEKKRTIVLDQLRTVEKARLVKHIGKLENRTQNAVLETLQEMFAK